MDEFKVPETEVFARCEKMQKELRQKEIEGILVCQRVDQFYFTGTAQRGFFYLPAEGEPLLCIKKYLPRAIRESPIKRIVPIDSVKEVPGRIEDHYGLLPRTMGLEFDVLTVRQFNFFKTLFPRQDFVDSSPGILRMRMIKSPWEIEQMENAAALSRDTFAYARAALRPGYTELEFAGLMETFARKHGHGAQLRVRDYQTEGYPWHILSGESGGMVGLLDAPASGEGTSAAFPCGAGHKLLAKNEPIMIDFGTVLKGYHIDETRFFAIGAMPKPVRKACEAAMDIHNRIIDMAKPGVALSELFQYGMARAEQSGYGDQFLGPQGYKVSFLAHGIGLELVEPPFIAKGRHDVLECGMTFALEPKMVQEGEWSAGIESVFTVTEKGGRLITQTPVEIFIV